MSDHARTHQNQFALLPWGSGAKVPRSWSRIRRGKWRLVHEPGLPVKETEDGFLLGWRLEGDGGRWLEIEFSGDEPRYIPDCCASLSVFLHPEKGAVSTLDLARRLGVAGDEHPNIATLREVRERTGTWHPCGFSEHTGWRLLLPTRTSIGGVEGRTPILVENFVETLAGHLGALASQFPLEISLTAGRDSRMILACSRSVKTRAVYYVEPPKPPHRGPEVEISKALAEILELNHRVGGEPDPWSALVFGFGGELARGHYWPDKMTDERPDAVALAKTLGYFPRKETFLVRQLDRWLLDHADSSPREIWDRLYLEQRMACTMAPLLYDRDRTARTSYFGLAHPDLIRIMTSLPDSFRRKWELADAVCKRGWPASALLPFNTLDYDAGRRLHAVAQFTAGRGDDFDRARRHPDLRAWLSGHGSSPIGGVWKDVKRKLRVG